MLDSILNGGKRRSNALVTGNFFAASTQRHIKIDPNKRCFIFQVEVPDGHFSHEAIVGKQPDLISDLSYPVTNKKSLLRHEETLVSSRIVLWVSARPSLAHYLHKGTSALLSKYYSPEGQMIAAAPTCGRSLNIEGKVDVNTTNSRPDF
jgi:hypothetical protein